MLRLKLRRNRSRRMMRVLHDDVLMRLYPYYDDTVIEVDDDE